MKASVIAYGGILTLLILTTFVFISVTAADPQERNVVSQEGKMIAFVNEAELVAKSYNQSLEFIFQRAAYDMGRKGGMENSLLWSKVYPSIEDLRSDLEKRIILNLPSRTIEGDNKISFGQRVAEISDYDSSACSNNANPKCFLVTGNESISIYNGDLQSRVEINPQKFLVKTSSNYFRLLEAGLALMQEATFNQHLGNAKDLRDAFYAAKSGGDGRFSGMDLEYKVSGSIVQITLVERCRLSDSYCLSPLNPGEIGELTDILYNYNKLIFKYSATQTGTPCPPQCTEKECGVSDCDGCLPGCSGSQTCNSDGHCITPTICPNTCTANALQCSSNNVQTCQKQSNGCYDWTTTSTCTSPMICSGGQCINSPPTCTDKCTANALQCSSNNVQTCQKQSNGCYDWTTTSTCVSPMICSGGQCIQTVQWRLVVDNPSMGKMHITTAQSGIDQDVTSATTFSNLRVGEQVTIKSIATSTIYKACTYPDGFPNSQTCTMGTYTSPPLTVTATSNGGIIHGNFHSTCVTEDPSEPSYCADTLNPPRVCVAPLEVCHSFATDCTCCCY
jgi:hypothetical protein